MSTTTPNMGLTKPDEDADDDLWDFMLNASLEEVDEHDHTTGKGVKVPVAGLNVNADLPMAGFAITQLKTCDLAAVLASSVSSYATCLFVSDADNELYWRNNGGTNVKITSGAALNAALLGGFTGDLGTGGSQANYNSGTGIFNFLRAATQRAFVDCSDVRLFQGTAGITNAVKVRSPNALAASYDFILPTALPGAQALLHLSTGGQVLTSNALAVNQSLTISGTARYKHGTHTLVLGAGQAYGIGTTVSVNGSVLLDNTSDISFWNMPFVPGVRLQAIRLVVTDNATGTTTVGATLYTKTTATLSATAAVANSAGTGAVQTISLSNLPITMAASTAYVLGAAPNQSNACSVHRLEIDYDFP